MTKNPTDEQIERGAKSMWEECKFKGSQYHNTQFEELNDYRKGIWRKYAKSVFIAMS